MKQIPLDIGLKPCPRLETWVAGPNQQLYAHVQQVLAQQGAVATTTYVWGPAGSGRTHLLQAVVQDLQDQGLHVGWLDAQCQFAPAFDQRWSAVVLDDVHRYNAQQQHIAFNWFVHARANDSGQPVWVLAAGDVPVTDLALRDDPRRPARGRAVGAQHRRRPARVVVGDRGGPLLRRHAVGPARPRRRRRAGRHGDPAGRR